MRPSAREAQEIGIEHGEWEHLEAVGRKHRSESKEGVESIQEPKGHVQSMYGSKGLERIRDSPRERPQESETERLERRLLWQPAHFPETGRTNGVGSDITNGDQANEVEDFGKVSYVAEA